MIAEEPIRTAIARMTLPRDIDDDPRAFALVGRAVGRKRSGEPDASVQELVVTGFWAAKWALKEQFGKNWSQISGIKFNN
jgi:hypothetical protein